MKNMRILMVNTRHYYGGGDSTYTFNLTDLLREHGHEVSFFAMQGERNLPDPNADLFVSHIDYRALNQRKNPLTAVQVLTRSIYSTEARRKFAALLERVQPDIVHLQNIHAHITPSVIFEAKKRGIPVVWTLHDYKLVCPNSHFLIDQNIEICEACRGGNFWQAPLKRCKKGSLLASGMASLEAYVHQIQGVRRRVDAFLCPSAFLRGKLLESGFDADQAHHLPLFLSSEYFQFSGSDDGYILFLGKLERLKGILPLIEAARRIPQVKLILAGRADETLQDILDDLPPNVEYLGFQTGEALDALRQNARALILPSLWYENQPVSILEAFGLGKPVIASDLGGMRELVGENERGILVTIGDVDALSKAMKWVADNEQGVLEIGKRAFSYVKEQHSAQAHYDRLMKTYRSLT